MLRSVRRCINGCFKSGRKHAQDIRIRTLLEIDVFQEIHAGWQRLGYPFPPLVPSYATALGEHPKPAIHDHLKTGQR